MQNTVAKPKVAHLFSPVKSTTFNKLSTPPNSMIHHKDYSFTNTIVYKYKKKNIPTPYGVSSSQRVLSPQLLLKRFNQVRDCLAEVCELTPAERDVTLELLRFQAYYPQVYPKASQIASETNHGVATFWRTVKRLQDMNLLEVVNRFLLRPEAQISNLYLLKGLIILIARYLAEHGVRFWEKWLEPYLSMPGSLFWRRVLSCASALSSHRRYNDILDIHILSEEG